MRFLLVLALFTPADALLQPPLQRFGLTRVVVLSAMADTRRTRTPVMNKRSKQASRKEALYITLQDDGSDMWRAEAAVEALKAGGCGVIPTDTSYSFVTPLSSKAGTQRILEFKGLGGEKKPLSLLCRSLADVELYTKGSTREGFKMLKAHLPGPFTFIMPASQNLPKGIYKDGKREWKRDSVGVRIPDDPVCAAILAELDEPLLCSSLPTSEEGSQLVCNRLPLDGDSSASWCTQVKRWDMYGVCV